MTLAGLGGSSARTRIEDMNAGQRKAVFREFIEEVVLPHRHRLRAYRRLTNQTAQVDSDGYLAQLLASIVVGVPGNARRGKTGAYKGDLRDGTEVKSSLRTEQKGGKEDAHLNFGSLTPQKMKHFVDRDRAILVFTTYDVLGRFKIEVVQLDLRSTKTLAAIEEFYERSVAARPQLQVRLYPDGVRNRLHNGLTSLSNLDSKLLARMVETSLGKATVDVWSPNKGVPLQEVLKVGEPAQPLPEEAPPPPEERSASRFFSVAMAEYRRHIKPYSLLTQNPQNIGFGNLSQHLVSLSIGVKGTDSNARGPDLVDGSEIKLAMGIRGDEMGTEDFPRLNLQNNVRKILDWPQLWPVRIVLENDRLMAKIFKPNMETFREQVRDYFWPGSAFCESSNMQYHIPRSFEDNKFTGLRGDRSPRVLDCEVQEEFRE